MENSLRYKFPPITGEALSNGLSLLVIEDHFQEGLTIALQLPIGEFCDPPGFEGMTEICISMLMKGPKGLTPEEFSERLEHVGAALFSEVGDEHCVIGCKLLSRYFPVVLPLFCDMILVPEFRQKELDRIKREMITGLQAETADPMSLANRHFTSLLCGTDHPAGRVQTPRCVRRITLSDVTSYYNTYFSPQETFFIAGGDFNSNDILTSLRSLWSSWNTPRKKHAIIGPGLSPLTSSKVRIVHKPDLSQVSLIVGHPVCGELGKLRNELALANYILGGGNFSSRLMASIRSKEGMTYGISSQISCNLDFGVFTIATSTQNSQFADMLSLIMQVYRECASKGITEEEMKKAKQFAIGNMAFQMEGIVNVTDKLLWLKQFSRDVSYIENFSEMIDKISLESINAAVKTYLSSSHFTIVGVGRKANIAPILKRYGDVEIVQFRKDPC